MPGLFILATFAAMAAFDTNWIFHIKNEEEFRHGALQIFNHQAKHNPVYSAFCHHLETDLQNIQAIEDIPFLPIQFFRSHKVITGKQEHSVVFSSSGTTGTTPSQHLVSDITIYEQSYSRCFENFYGSPSEYCILALLPSYLEREGSSLIYMVRDLIDRSGHPDSGFYLKDLNALKKKLSALEQQQVKTLLIGVSFALLDLVVGFPFQLKHTVVMETGGMKGRRKEMVRKELHQILEQSLGVTAIHSEYGMTELLSQAYSKGKGRFWCPPWMKVLSREPEDPLSLQKPGRTGGLNVIDLANIHSCSFIATQDLGKVYDDGSFEVLGRFDHAEIRGCNLMVI